ncbi:hypothetical protein GGS20DRAFT_534928 [Poronia punctata]|nr:hypothetical protein GGS20DRAFT_534928 [Poronia punctata]
MPEVAYLPIYLITRPALFFFLSLSLFQPHSLVLAKFDLKYIYIKRIGSVHVGGKFFSYIIFITI